MKAKIEVIDTSKIEIAKESFFGKIGSYYSPVGNVIGITYHKHLNPDDAFKVLIFDINHETEHQLLYHFINDGVSGDLDNIVWDLMSYLLIGFDGIKDLNRIRDLFKE